MSATEILALETINAPESESDLTLDLELLHLWRDRQDWVKNTQLETSLLRCSYLIFLQPSQTDNCTKILKQLLGTVDYNYLLILLGYIKLCHQWVIDRPEISHQQDRRSQLHLGSLLLSDIRLGEFLQANLQLESLQKTLNKNPLPTDLKLSSCIVKDITEVVHYQKLMEIESQLEAIQRLARENLNLPEVAHPDRPLQPNIARSFQELKNVVDLLPSYLCVTDIYNQTVSLVNLKLSQSLGLSNTELARGKIISECFPPEYTRQIIWQQQQVLTYEKELHFREEVTLADGIHYFDTTIAPMRNDDGEIYALLHTSNDVPDLTTTKEALSQRTIQLEAANKELESFSYSVSHDLQKPLRAINSFSQVLWKNYQSSLDDRAKHYLQRIQVNSKKMKDSIDALLRLSRVTRSQMRSVKVNLSQIAQNIFEELQTNEPERLVEFVNTPNMIAKGDPQLLRIALSNLLDNAWKYTSKRSLAKIEFSYKLGVDDRKIYFVRDNGAGFDLEYAERLFTAFHRLHSEEEFPGTGIGLATVRRIIYRHGGKVWAEGKCDRGATIYFSL